MAQMSADIRGLEKQMAKAVAVADKGAKDVQRKFDGLKIGGGNLGAGLAKDLGALTGKLVGTAQSATGLSGTFEALGGTGMAAAAGIGAVLAAFAAGSKATEWADDLTATANRIGVTTTALQEWEHVAQRSDVSVQAMDEGLQSLNESLGKVQNGGKGSAKVLAEFTRLGFTKEQLKGYTDASALLPDLSAKFATMGDQAQKAAVAAKLGVSGILPVLMQGKDGISNLIDEAHRFGIVVDEALVRKGGEAHDQLELMNEVIKAQLTGAFIELAPLVVDVSTAFAHAATAFASFAHTLADNWPAIEHTVDLLTGLLNKISGASAFAGKKGDFFGRGPDGKPLADDPLGRAIAGAGNLWDGYAARQRAAPLRAGVNDLLSGKPIDMSGMQERAKPAAYDPRLAGASGGGSGRKSGGAAPVDRTDQAIAQAQAQELQAHISVLRALLDGADKTQQQSALLEQMAALENQEIDAKRKQRDERIENDKSISAEGKKQALALSAQTAESEHRVVAMKLQRDVDQNLLDATRQQWENAKAVAELDAETQGIYAAIATTAKERHEIELRALRARQQRERTDLETAQEQAILNGTQTAGGMAQQMQSQAALHAAQIKQLDVEQRGPMQQYLHSLDDISTKLDEVKAEGLDALTNGITDAITGAKSLGDAFHDIANQIIADLVRIAVQKYITNAIAGTLFGGGGLLGGLFGGGSSAPTAILHAHAGGTDFAPGGLSLVGERGPELLNIPRGSQVIPNDILRGMSMPSAVTSRPIEQTIILQVQAGEMFDARVASVAGPIAVHSGAIAAQAGSAIAAERQSRRARQIVR